MMLTRKMMERVAVTAAADEGVFDLHPRELEFYFDGLVSILALKAVCLATAKDDDILALNSSSGLLDFEELPRHELLKHLEHCSGLPSRACEKMLDGVNSLIGAHLMADDGPVSLEHVGEMVRGKRGYSLILEERLQVRKSQKL